MAQYIDKSALVAEIEKCYNECLKRAKITDSNYWYAKSDAYRNVLSILDDTLEVKEVDLEKELIKWHKEHFKKDGTFIGMSGFYLTNSSQMDIAKHFFELGLKAQKGE